MLSPHIKIVFVEVTIGSIVHLHYQTLRSSIANVDHRASNKLKGKNIEHMPQSDLSTGELSDLEQHEEQFI